MKRLLLLRPALLMLLAVLSAPLRAQLLPTPRSEQPLPAAPFVLDEGVTIAATPDLLPLAEWLTGRLPLRIATRTTPLSRSIALSLDPALPAEHYRLTVWSDRIEAVGADRGGLFYALQTLLQLLPAEVWSSGCRFPVQIACCRIDDGPAFGYRGMHFDVARTFVRPDQLRRLVDLMACHKLNRLHLHLCDDEGWRIEIRSHPELALEGGFRGGDSPVASVYGRWGRRYGGYYTQDEMRELIRYAALRNIEIIPEIDLPGHSRAIARLHPEILCRYTPNLTASEGYDTRSAWCVAREENYVLLEEILGELCDLFPSEVIHIGGDEVEVSQWERCPDCQALRRREGLTTAQLERHFLERLIRFLERRGKRPAVWNEAADGTLSRTARVHGWKDVRVCREAAARGYETVVMPGAWFYFDMRQSAREEGHLWAAIFDASKVYGFDLTRQGFTAGEQARVIGFEGAFWSEIHLANRPEENGYMDYMLFPRMAALAEICWSSAPRDWARFRATLEGAHADRLAAMGVGFRLWPPEVRYAGGRLTASVGDRSTLYYTVEPDSVEHLYEGPIQTTAPERYRFRSRFGPARSPWTATAAHYRTLTPAVRLSASFRFSEKAPAERVERYAADAWTTRTCRAGDWFRFDFEQPVHCREITVQTGYAHLARSIIPVGTVEISTDGTRFEPAGTLTDGVCTLRPTAPVRALRITAGETGNGTATVILQPLRIKP